MGNAKKAETHPDMSGIYDRGSSGWVSGLPTAPESPIHMANGPGTIGPDDTVAATEHAHLHPPGNRPEQKDAHDDREAWVKNMTVPKMLPSQVRKRNWDQGDVMATVYYGPSKERVGQVRLRGVSKQTRANLLSVSSRVTIWFKYLCTVEEYEVLSHNVSSEGYSLL